METEILNVLFVCSMNQWRSPTAEEIYRRQPHLACRSAGTSAKARRRITVSDIRWADLIVVMEQKHRNRIAADFRDEIRHKDIQVLELEDRFEFMNPELISELRFALDPLLGIES